MSTTDIKNTIEQGRNVMPSWSIRYQGALDDQQINDILNYLVSMSSENVPFEDNICINPDAVKAVELAVGLAGGTSGATGSTGPRASSSGATGATGRRGERLMLAQECTPVSDSTSSAARCSRARARRPWRSSCSSAACT
jgi:hypothetical protein